MVIQKIIKIKKFKLCYFNKFVIIKTTENIKLSVVF